MTKLKGILLTEGMHGMISQVEGLAKALEIDFTHHKVELNNFWKFFPPKLTPVSQKVFKKLDIVDFDIIISCGRKSVVPSIYLKQNSKKKIINILNENNFSNDDCIIITRSFIIKAKKLLALSKEFETNKNIDLTISSAKPPIFWKEKEITKQQIYKWSPKNIKQLIYALSETELQIKKNINNSINLITDFILSQSSSETNS